ncbi:MAG: hypothetical protein EHM34_02410 [Nitrosopumilales archaeon]|nr:MAG: hypothetical protein EHM34_02410 [Nitrosopumilales archaeon]
MNYGMAGPQRSSGPRLRGYQDKIPKGYQKEVAQLQNFTPEQMQQHQSLFQHVGPDSYLSRLAGGDQSLFDEMEAPALRQFNQIQGGIASRFSGGGGGQGAMSSRRSSGFQNTMSAKASDFAQQLQANRQNLQRQGLSDLFNMSNMLLSQNPYDRSLVKKEEKQPSGWGGLAGGIAGGIGGAFLGQPVLGAQLGSALGSQF